MANIIINRHRIRPKDKVQQRELAEARAIAMKPNYHRPAKVDSAKEFLNGFGQKVVRKDIFGDPIKED